MKTELRILPWLAALTLCVVATASAETPVSTTPTGAQSLIDPATFRGPAADRGAYRVGDLLTVYVLVASSAKSQATTGSDRSSQVHAGLHSPSTQYDADLGLQGKHSGTGQTVRTGELQTQLAVRVTAIESNGLLRIAGSQSLRVNGEDQRFTLNGLVRPEDISADNIIWSNRIAEAEVSLSGKGVVNDSQRRGVIATVMHWLGLP